MIDFCRTVPINPLGGLIITDHEATIKYVDERHSAFFGRRPESEVGKDIGILNKCTGFPHVIHTGRSTICSSFNFRGKEFIGSIIPLRRKNIVFGAMGLILFSDIGVFKNLIEISTFDDYSHIANQALNETDINFDNIISASETLRNIKELSIRGSRLDFPILISGETGTGKTMFAKAIHNASPRRNYPFVAMNCATIPKDLFETEFFGYAPGAFSGANPKGKPGKIEIVHRGTLLLDEVGNLPFEFQVKLLDTLQEKKIVRVGDVKPLNIDFRLITATSEDLERMVQEKLFRSDLYFRINVINIHLPPLRERKEDIPILIGYKLKEISEKYELPQMMHIEEDLVKHLIEYSFPGNVRELFNIVERAVFNRDENRVAKEDLSLFEQENFIQKDPPSLKILIEKTEKEAISKVLSSTKGDVTDAAKILDIHRTTLYKKIEKYHISSNI